MGTQAERVGRGGVFTVRRRVEFGVVLLQSRASVGIRRRFTRPTSRALSSRLSRQPHRLHLHDERHLRRATSIHSHRRLRPRRTRLAVSPTSAHITRGASSSPRRRRTPPIPSLHRRSRPSQSKIPKLPAARGVDFRASCFCHKRPVSVGFVCSVCLSIFCERRAACACGADFSDAAVDASPTVAPTAA